MFIRARHFLRTSDEPGTAPATTAPPAPVTSTSEAPAKPTASLIVVESRKTEAEMRLEAQNEVLAKTLKAREVEAATLADENFRLKQAGLTTTTPPPTPKKPKPSFGWWPEE